MALPGEKKTITVEPLEVPDPVPVEEPAEKPSEPVPA